MLLKQDIIQLLLPQLLSWHTIPFRRHLLALLRCRLKGEKKDLDELFPALAVTFTERKESEKKKFRAEVSGSQEKGG